MSRLQSVEKTQLPLSGNWVSITYTTENRQVLRTPLLLQCVTEMCDGAGSDAEYAGMAVYTPHGGRGRSAAGRREKSAHGRKERIPQRISSTPLGYPDGGTMYLMVPKVRQGGYIPFFVTGRKRSEAMIVQVV